MMGLLLFLCLLRHNQQRRNTSNDCRCDRESTNAVILANCGAVIEHNKDASDDWMRLRPADKTSCHDSHSSGLKQVSGIK